MAILVIGVGLAACGGSSSDRGTLTVFAAASLADVLRAVDPDARYSFAGSDELAAQIRAGAPADVFAAASPKYPQQLRSEGLVARPVTFATNRLVVIVPRSNPAGVDTIEQVAEPGLKLVIGGEGVPIGDYTRQVLRALGLEEALRNVVSEEQNVSSVLTKVASGEADAGFVYATDVARAPEDVQVVEVPERAQPLVEYQVAVVSASGRSTEAEAFVRELLGARGRAALARAGFGLP